MLQLEYFGKSLTQVKYSIGPGATSRYYNFLFGSVDGFHCNVKLRTIVGPLLEGPLLEFKPVSLVLFFIFIFFDLLCLYLCNTKSMLIFHIVEYDNWMLHHQKFRSFDDYYFGIQNSVIPGHL